ncbi:MAG: 4Fe-4S dicluster domain-containing protein [candidate division WOR-3 bacterium]
MINYLIKPIFVVINNLGEFFLRKRGFYFFRILDFPDFNLFIISILGLILGGVIYFSLKEGRFYCNSICPLGTFLSLVSFRSLCRIEIDKLRCTSCGICEFNCKGSCINSKEKIIDDFSCIRCFNCLSICPFSAIRFRFVSFIKKRKEKNIERRKFILYLTYICFLGINLFLREKGKKLSNSSPPTPPGSISLKRFLSKCTSCYLCVNRCPTGVLRPSLFQYGIFGAFVPFMDFRSGYCSYECNECLNICPTNAILPFRLEEKKKIQIGRVNFTQDFCVVYKNKTNCGACAEICPTEAIRMVPYKGLLSIPFTEPSICVGCGGCAFVCPATPKAIVIETNLVHREVKSFERSKNKKENRKEEFPF